MKTNFKTQQRVLTGRDARRWQERERKAEEGRQRLEAFRRLTPLQRAEYMETSEAVARIQRNGITLQDLERNFDKGVKQGYEKGAEHSLKACYAAVCLTLKKLYGFGGKRCMNVLQAMDEHILYALTDEELIDKVFEDMKLEIRFSETFPEDRITEVEHAG